jgi:dihydroorotate dehydrogenase electron transfer subunit
LASSLTLLPPPRVHVTKVLDRRALAADVVLIGLHAPDLARVTLPGQYVMVVPPVGEQAATALGVYEAAGERVSLLFFVSGKRTAELAELRVGESVSCLGPLGNGFDVSGQAQKAAVVAGGVGIASVLLAAQALVRNGARVKLYYGARSAERLVEAQRFADEGCVVCVATDDGSVGHRGFVTDLLAGDEDAPDLILACGPSPMLRAVGRVAQERNIPAQLSLEETFACGVGGCWGCVVPIVNTSPQAPRFPSAAQGGSDVVNARVCKEGPVFWAHELRW